MWWFAAECLCFTECFFLVCNVFSALGKEFVCLVPLFYRVCFFAALSKELVCQVLDRMHLANIFAPGTSAVSDNEIRDEDNADCESVSTYIRKCAMRKSKALQTNWKFHITLANHILDLEILFVRMNNQLCQVEKSGSL